MIRLISGGQTGIDRLALDLALALGLPVGGWCPLDRKAEDGHIPARYPLREASSGLYQERTRLNVRDADATVVVTAGPPERGSALTVRLAGQLRRPCLVLDLVSLVPPQAPAPGAERALRRQLAAWLAARPRLQVLNLAGPRCSQAPALLAPARAVLLPILRAWRRCSRREPTPPWPPARPSTPALPLGGEA